MNASFKLTEEQREIITYFLPYGYKLVQNHITVQKAMIPSEKPAIKKINKPIVKQLTEEQQRMLFLIARLKKHPAGQNFIKMNYDVKLSGFEYIDLTIIEKKIISGRLLNHSILQGSYQTNNQLRSDIRRLWQFSYFYHHKQSELYLQTIEAEKYFETIYTEMDEAKNISDLSQKVQKLTKEIEQVKKQSTEPQQTNRNKKVKVESKAIKSSSQQSVEIISEAEKRTLGMNIRNLPQSCLKGVWKIIGAGMMQNEIENGMITVDIEHLEPLKIRQLQQYVESQSKQQLNIIVIIWQATTFISLRRIDKAYKIKQKSKQILYIIVYYIQQDY